MESYKAKGSIFSFNILLDIIKKEELVINKKIRLKTNYETKISSPIRILMAEDNRINAEFTKEMLEKLKCEVVTAKNGIEAIEILKNDVKFDLIFMDCQMPVMDGFKATENIINYEKENNRKHIPIIALTANAMKGDGEKCLEVGMDDYLAKPVRQRDFVRMLEKWLGNKLNENN